MDSGRYQRLAAAFESWQELEGPARDAFVRDLETEDHDLASKLSGLIDADATGAGFLDPADLFGRIDLEAARIGERFGAYRLVSPLGDGGMGAVFLAERADAQFDQQVAIKLIHAGLGAEASVRFRDERRILASLSHPYIAHLFDGGETPAGQPYLVMEYVPGEPITSYCDHLALDTAARLQLCLKVCEAIQYTHQHLVVHRDIKPSNILVTSDGTPKLLDFGIARLVQTAHAAPARTLPLLTPEYASPEQVRNLPVTTAGDVYSFGVLMYELLAGARPFTASGNVGDLLALLDRICREEPERPSVAARRHGRILDADLDAILLKALRKEPADRYASVEQLAADVRAYSTGRPVLARGGTGLYRARKFAARHWAGVAATVVAVAGLAGGIVLSQRQAAIAQAERARAERRFDDVRQLANSVVFEFDRSLRDVPGSTAARRQLLDGALQYLERLVADASDDPALLRELATGYQRVGEVQGDPFFRNLGDAEGAARSYQRAADLRQRLLAQPGATDDDQAAYALAITGQGDLLWAKGDFGGALDRYDRALTINRALAERHAGDIERGYSAARSAYTSGQALTKLGRFGPALEDYQASLSWAEAAMAQHPERVEFGVRAAGAGMKVGDCLRRSGDARGALEQYERGVARSRAIFEKAPESETYNRITAFLLGRQALALIEVGQMAEAQRTALEAADLHRRRERLDPADRQSQVDVATSLSDVGAAAFFAGRMRAARDAYADSIARFERLVRTGPTSVDMRSDYGVVLRRAGDASRQAGRTGEAEAYYKAAVAELGREPRDFEYEAELAVAQARVGEVGGAASRDWLARSLETWRLAEGRGVRAGRLQPGGAAVVQEMLNRGSRSSD